MGLSHRPEGDKPVGSSRAGWRETLDLIRNLFLPNTQLGIATRLVALAIVAMATLRTFDHPLVSVLAGAVVLSASFAIITVTLAIFGPSMRSEIGAFAKWILAPIKRLFSKKRPEQLELQLDNVVPFRTEHASD